MDIKQTYKIYKSGGFKDKDMKRAFYRELTPTVVAQLIEELTTAKQEATAYRISLENTEQLIKDFVACRVEVGDTFGIAYGRFDEACKKANKLEAGE